MPRSDKPISTGSLSDPVTSARSRTWTSHANPEDSEQFEPDGLSLVDPLTQEPVEAVVNLIDPVKPAVTITEPEPNPDPEIVVRPPVYEWLTVQSIDGRTYTRLDERHEVVEDE